MARGPSVKALLALLAIAGWQNRDKISDMLTDARKRAQDPDRPAGGADGQSPSILSDISEMFTGAAGGTALGAGLRDLLGSFETAGRKQAADSWVSRDANHDVEGSDLEAAIGRETLDQLSRETGLSHAEIVERLSDGVPRMVDRFTPEGRVPDDADMQRFV